MRTLLNKDIAIILMPKIKRKYFYMFYPQDTSLRFFGRFTWVQSAHSAGDHTSSNKQANTGEPSSHSDTRDDHTPNNLRMVAPGMDQSRRTTNAISKSKRIPMMKYHLNFLQMMNLKV